MIVPQNLKVLLPDDAEPILVRFAQYWIDLRGNRDLPDYAEIDPVKISWALSATFVVQQREQDGLFFYRLAGEEVASRLGKMLKGKTAFDVFETDYAAWTQKRWQRSIDEVAACFVDTSHQTTDGRPITARRLLFPLRGRSGRLDTLIGVGVFNRTYPGLNYAPKDVGERQARWVPVSQLAAA